MTAFLLTAVLTLGGSPPYGLPSQPLRIPKQRYITLGRKDRYRANLYTTQ